MVFFSPRPAAHVLRTCQGWGTHRPVLLTRAMYFRSVRIETIPSARGATLRRARLVKIWRGDPFTFRKCNKDATDLVLTFQSLRSLAAIRRHQPISLCSKNHLTVLSSCIVCVWFQVSTARVRCLLVVCFEKNS